MWSDIFLVVVVVLAIVMAGPRFDDAHQPITLPPASDLTGQTIVVTGGTSGVGHQAALELASRGGRVVLTGRSKGRADTAAAQLTGTGHFGLALDLTSHDSVLTFAKEVKKLKKVDVLLFNAGMIYGPDFTGPFQTGTYPGGLVDTMIASNHLGSFALVQELLSLLESSGTRVVFVSSISHHLGTPALLEDTADPVGGVDGSTLGAGQAVRAFGLYGDTKLLNVLTANRLERECESCSVVVVTPGFCATSMGSADRTPGIFNPAEYLPLTFSAKQGGDMLVAATQVDSAEVAGGKMMQPYWIWEDVPLLQGRWKGALFNLVEEMLFQRLVPPGIYVHTQSDAGLDELLQDRAWDWSMQMVGK
ncbi:hypothetical protein TeGR_g11791 [Tetraparma gracilis]|uniref:Uncharacterized protein n=1 Tax=Tetraparma gracilis TaxID=2962635 RepID=A0ABQ6ND87_9STRA|nr:hypothetical protein TeGR_g11791 [Tetraparma gracilis]